MRGAGNAALRGLKRIYRNIYSLYIDGRPIASRSKLSIKFKERKLVIREQNCKIEMIPRAISLRFQEEDRTTHLEGRELEFAPIFTFTIVRRIS